jgi:hypothetical protein
MLSQALLLIRHVLVRYIVSYILLVFLPFAHQGQLRPVPQAKPFFPEIIIGFDLFCLTSFVQAESKLTVVASFSMLDDFVQQITNDRVNLTILVGRDLVIINGIDFEGWITRLLKSFSF